MNYFKKFLTNLVALIVIFLAMYLIFPDVMTQVSQLFGALFGPGLVILLVIVAALPNRKNKRVR